MKETIPIIRPNIRIEDVKADVTEILASGILTGGKYVEEFETTVAEWVGVRHGIATTSATTAIHLALVAAGIGPGDEVLLSDFTYPATANAVIQTGATPVFVDSGANDLGIDPELAKSLVTERTQAIVPVDPFGQPADHLSLQKIAQDVGARVVVDAACSLGASRDHRRCGSHGDMGCFSFHPRKVVTCGEGGMVTTDDSAFAARLRLLRNHGAQKSSSGITEFVDIGFNYRLGEIPAALGLEQTRRLDQILSDRRRTANRYDRELTGVAGISVLKPPKDTAWSYQSYVIVLDESIDRNQTIVLMKKNGVEVAVGTYACHEQPAFMRWGYQPGDLPNSYRYANTTLTLPLIPRMSNTQVERVIETLLSAVESN